MSNRNAHQMRVEEMMVKAGQEIPLCPTIPKQSIRLLRAKLILEECIETIQALGFNPHVVPVGEDKLKLELSPHDRGCNLIEVADGCADISVVTIGTLSAFGIEAEPLLELIDESNLNKFRGDAHRREDGKWIKPSDWTPPDIKKELLAQGCDEWLVSAEAKV